MIEYRSKLDPKEAFICPPLTVSRKRKLDPDSVQPTKSDDITPELLLTSPDNFHILGGRESGKTSLAHYLSVLAAEGVIDRPRIPIIIDFCKLKRGECGLTRAIATYFGTLRQGLSVEDRLKEGDFVIIVDNFPNALSQSVKDFIQLKAKYKLVRWILLSDSTIATPESSLGKDADFDIRVVHIQTLPRRLIRELSKRWTDQIGVDNQKAFSTVMAYLKTSHLPRTGYMVTLILWGIYQEKRLDRINEALLLTNVIDHLLGKANFAESLSNTFDPVSKEITLQYIAMIMRDSRGVMSKNDALKSLIEFFERKGLRYDADRVFATLVRCGLLTDFDGTVSFKYRCFEEYFYANFLRTDASALQRVLSDRTFC